MEGWGHWGRPDTAPCVLPSCPGSPGIPGMGKLGQLLLLLKDPALLKSLDLSSWKPPLGISLVWAGAKGRPGNSQH